MKEELLQVLSDYKARAVLRKENENLPPRPLQADEVAMIIDALRIDQLINENFIIFKEERVDQLLLRLLADQVRRGTFRSSSVKAKGLAKYIRGELSSDFLSPLQALQLLAAMKGGAATVQLVDLLSETDYQHEIIEILKETVLVNQEEFARLAKLAAMIPEINNLIKYWAERGFARTWRLKDSYQGVAIKVGDNVTTGHLSPSQHANSRTDHPLHAKFMMDGREDQADFLERLNSLKEKQRNVFLVAGESLGEGSSRKSATYNLLQVLGQKVEGEPEKKKGGVIIAKSIAPIFFNSLIASGILPLIGDTDLLKEGDCLLLRPGKKKVLINGKRELKVELPLQYQLEKVAAGGIIYFDAGNELQQWATKYCQEQGINYRQVQGPRVISKGREKPAQTLAQKIVGMNRIDGQSVILPGETAEVRIRGVFSQDTTGPMTIEEYQAIGGGEFGAEFVIQSLCHTGECPSTAERDRHKFLDQFVTARGGACLKPGEGIIHTIGNRFVLPIDLILGEIRIPGHRPDSLFRPLLILWPE